MESIFYQKEYAKQFYEKRYEDGYMDDWPVEKKQRVFDIIKSLPISSAGLVLDFGCGNGVFTEVIRQALPQCKVYGCDISEQAIENAQKRYPDCIFFVSDGNSSGMKFDFLFSHHVLEHVYNIEKTVDEINSFLKPQAFQLHILPCGNKDSFEYNLCKMRTDGINENMQNRFFYEDIGHLRRLTTNETNKLFGKLGFLLEKDFYSNQYYGALQWISTYDEQFILDFTDSNKAKNPQAADSLKKIRSKLISYHKHRNRAKEFTYKSIFRSIYYHIKMIVKLIITLAVLPFSKLIINNLDKKADREWDQNRENENGSEMYLFYSRK